MHAGGPTADRQPSQAREESGSGPPSPLDALKLFAALPLRERLFVRARLRSAPLDALAARVPATGFIADVGCGHGLLSAMLAMGHPQRSVLGIDPDERKIAWAERGPARLANARFRVATVEDLLPEFERALDAVVIADVLYLLPVETWPSLLAACHRLLKPDGRLLLKEAEANGSWKHWKCALQEWIMVRLVGKTRSSGGLGFRPRAFLEAALRASAFRIREVADLSTGYSTPHVLFVATPEHGG